MEEKTECSWFGCDRYTARIGGRHRPGYRKFCYHHNQVARKLRKLGLSEKSIDYVAKEGLEHGDKTKVRLERMHAQCGDDRREGRELPQVLPASPGGVSQCSTGLECSTSRCFCPPCCPMRCSTGKVAECGTG